MAETPFKLHDGQQDKKLYDVSAAGIPMSPRSRKDVDNDLPSTSTYMPILDASRSRLRDSQHKSSGAYMIAVASILGGILCAAVVAGGHHAFGTRLRGRPINDRHDLWARYVVQLSNLLAALVAAFLAVSLAASLLQIIWYRVASHRVRIATLDRAFSISTPLGLLRAFLAFRGWHVLFPAILVAAIYQAAVLVSIIAPSSIIPGIAPEETLNLTVSTVDMANFLVTDDFAYVLNAGDSTLSSTVIGPIMLQSMLSSYTLASPPPAGCGLSCKYTLRYYAPAIDCREMARVEIIDGNRFGQPVSNMTHPLYHANMWYGINRTDSPSTNSLSLAYQTNFSTPAQPHDMYGFPINRDYSGVRGTVCQFAYGTYDVNYEWKNNDYHIDLDVKKGKPLGNTQWRDRNIENDIDIEPANWPPGMTDALKVNYIMNHVFIIEIFQTLLAGTVEQIIATPGDPFTTVTYNRTQVLFTPLFKLHQRFDPDMTTVNFTTAYDYMPGAISRMFTYMTYALASANLSTVAVPVTNVPDVSVWTYSPKQLWTVYGIGLAVTSIVALCGLWCLHRNGFTGDNTFSHFLATTRQPQLESAIRDEGVRLEFGRTASGQREFMLAG